MGQTTGLPSVYVVVAAAAAAAVVWNIRESELDEGIGTVAHGFDDGEEGRAECFGRGGDGGGEGNSRGGQEHGRARRDLFAPLINLDDDERERAIAGAAFTRGALLRLVEIPTRARDGGSKLAMPLRRRRSRLLDSASFRRVHPAE